MALSPNYGFPEPDNSSLVKNGAQDIRALGDAVDTAIWNVGYGQAGKNKIINGDFGIWQRGTSFAAIAGGAYSADRWVHSQDGTGNVTISQQTFTPGTAPVAGYEGTYFLRSAVTSTGTASYLEETQRIEDVRTFAGQTVTFSFWAKADSARSSIVYPIQVFGTGGSGAVVVATPSITYSTSWTRYSFTFGIPSVSGKTIGTGSYLGFNIRTPHASGSTLDIWGVQAEYGAKMTPFETATGTIEGELAACQRYYWRATAGSQFLSLGMGNADSAGTLQVIVKNPVTMRVRPTELDTSAMSTFYWFTGAVTGNTPTSVTLSLLVTADSPVVLVSKAASFVAGSNYMLLANTGSVAYLGFSAEL